MTFQLTNIPTNDRAKSLSYPTKVIQQTSAAVYRTIGKRAFDIVFVLATGLITMPLIALIALALVLSGQKPFYSQLRLGKNGSVFRMWKLRTMVNDADARLDAYLAENPEAKIEWDTKQKLTNDPRVSSPIGAWLRKTSLDELPQIFNVLNGSMSLVGPRPMMVDQQDKYSGEAYYRLRPGMTGLWQISDRNNCEFAGRVAYDDAYDGHLSFRMDASVILRTVGVVVRAKGC